MSRVVCSWPTRTGPRRVWRAMWTLRPGRVPITTSASNVLRWAASRASVSSLYCLWRGGAAAETRAGRGRAGAGVVGALTIVVGAVFAQIDEVAHADVRRDSQRRLVPGTKDRDDLHVVPLREHLGEIERGTYRAA